MTDEINKQMQDHERLIEKANRENWFMKPIPLDEKLSRLRMAQIQGWRAPPLPKVNLKR